MQITTIYNYQETCISCTLQCQELGATGRQLSFKLCCSRDTARTMYLCISNNDQYPKYILSYLILPQVDSFSVRGTLHLSRSHKALVCYEENLKFNFEKLFTQDESLIQFRNFVRMLAHFCFYSTLFRVSSYSSTIYIIPVVLLTVAWNITR